MTDSLIHHITTDRRTYYALATTGFAALWAWNGPLVYAFGNAAASAYFLHLMWKDRPRAPEPYTESAKALDDYAKAWKAAREGVANSPNVVELRPPEAFS
jgi:hypothetical protein